jgi:hypothetical protein
MALGPLDCVEAIVLHAGFRDRLNDGEVGLTVTPRATKGLAAVVDFLKATDAQRGIAPANVAAHPHSAERLAQRTEGVGFMGLPAALQWTISHSKRLVVAVAKKEVRPRAMVDFLAGLDAAGARPYAKLVFLERLVSTFSADSVAAQPGAPTGAGKRSWAYSDHCPGRRYL